jgi:soluble lytic murein transglycosylase
MRPLDRRWIGGAVVVGALGIWIYSGSAWIFFRPVLHKPLINRYAAQYQFDPLWVMSIIKVESRFAASAQSHRGAIGLMQLLPSTAQELAHDLGMANIQSADLKDPEINLRLGVYYLARLERMFPEDETAILAAYNAGPGITFQWRQGKPTLDMADIAYPETRRFVRRVRQTYHWLKMIQGWKHLFGADHG